MIILDGMASSGCMYTLQWPARNRTSPFVQATWSIVTSWERINLQPALQTPSNSLVHWWESASLSIPKEKKRDFNGMAIYTMWNLWKEHNRRTFDKYYTATQVAERSKEDIEQYRRAFATAH
jgi:hypothetical protein